MEQKRKLLIDTFLEINKKVNLSAIRDAEGVYVKHICDSLEAQKILDIDPKRTIADIGTGGGFPLLPLAMIYPDNYFVGIDSIKKKLAAIQEIADTMEIKNIELIWSRVEDIHKQFDVVTARAVAYIDVLLKWISPIVKKGGYVILYKQDIGEEYVLMKKLLPTYGLRLVKEHDYSLFQGDIPRVLYLLQRK